MKISQMGWQVKADMEGQPKPGLWGSNMKMENIYPAAFGCEFIVFIFDLKVITLGGVNQFELFFLKKG